ncbi:MAG: ATP-binding protein [Bifidobacteriaceae bacterium]|jgi:predicted AAA+ superfamily ATPase|nr:ATP-binding protein [Bifidobacteriaceae bacterium]
MGTGPGDYLPRLIDPQVKAALGRAGAVLVEGPKACGKTTTALRHAASQVRLDLQPQLRRAAQIDPPSVLAGPAPRLIDEWQLAPDLWNAVRAEVDARQADGQFILAGSATPADDITRHSGAMRFARVVMRPLSLAESGESDGSVSIAGLWEGAPARGGEPLGGLAELAEAVCRGGWPSNRRRSTDDAAASNRDYVRAMAAGDIVTTDGVRRDPSRMAALIFALARNSATYVSNRTLMADSALYGESLSAKTVADYLGALARLWVLVDQPAWGGHLRSAAQVRRAPKRHLVDPSLAAAAIGATPDSLTADPAAFGQLFESLVYRDLTVYSQPWDGQVRAFAEPAAELDAVLVRGVDWAGLEVKLSAAPPAVDSAAAGLARIAARMSRPPRFLAVITGSGPSYARPDGVQVVSIRHLGP